MCFSPGPCEGLSSAYIALCVSLFNFIRSFSSFFCSSRSREQRLQYRACLFRRASSEIVPHFGHCSTQKENFFMSGLEFGFAYCMEIGSLHHAPHNPAKISSRSHFLARHGMYFISTLLFLFLVSSSRLFLEESLGRLLRFLLYHGGS